METDVCRAFRYPLAMMEDWLQQALESSGMKQAELARQLHAKFNWPDDRSVINKVLKHKRKLSAIEAMQIAKITMHPLPGGVMEAVEEEVRSAQPTGDLRPLDTPIGFIHITGKVAANTWMDVDSMDFGYDDLEVVPTLGGIPPEWQFALVVEGKCLNKVANHGDKLICLDLVKAHGDAQPEDLVIVERRRFAGQMVERTAKRLKKTAKGMELWPESFEPEHQEPIALYEPHEDVEIRIVAKVLWVMRKP